MVQKMRNDFRGVFGGGYEVLGLQHWVNAPTSIPNQTHEMANKMKLQSITLHTSWSITVVITSREVLIFLPLHWLTGVLKQRGQVLLSASTTLGEMCSLD